MQNAVVRAHQLSKVFKVATRGRGFLGSVRALTSRSYREVQAVRDVSFSIRPGEIVGYLGPNGAGKSTTIKMLSGILHPSGGEVQVAGFSPQRERTEVARRIGAVFGQRTQLWWDLPVADSLELLAAMYDVPADRLRAQRARFTQLLGLDEFIDVPVRKLSLGQRMRADLAAALLHEPPVLFLDEPTIGLDVVAKSRIRDFLGTLNRETGVTVLLTTHDLTDIEQLCDRVIVINHGCLVYDDSIDQLRKRAGVPTRMTVEFAPSTPVDMTGIERLPGPYTVVEQDGVWLTVTFDRAQIGAGSVITSLAQYGEIRDVRIAEPNLEEIIRRLYDDGPAPDLDQRLQDGA